MDETRPPTSLGDETDAVSKITDAVANLSATEAERLSLNSATN